MDTTKQNILMCEKAVEIQKLWKPQAGDFYDSRGPTEIKGFKVLQNPKGFKVYRYSKAIHPKGAIHQHIWLPRQDQLQGILNIDDFTYLVSDFSEWVYQQKGFMYHLPGEQLAKEFTSIEQLWLAFAMKEKYQKIWSGKDWVKA